MAFERAIAMCHGASDQPTHVLPAQGMPSVAIDPLTHHTATSNNTFCAFDIADVFTASVPDDSSVDSTPDLLYQPPDDDSSCASVDSIESLTDASAHIPVPVYHVNAHSAQASRKQRGSLVDRGANGGILGNDARVFLQHHHEVDVTGIDNHQINALKLVDAAAKVTTNKGPAILIMR